jgi:ribosome biogenesis protein Nip4
VHLAAGLTDDSWSSAAAWGDIDGDGWLDLYVAHYVDWSFANNHPCTGIRPEDIDICPPKVYKPLPDTLYHNEGDGTFTDVSASSGLRKDGKGLGVITADVDLDGDIDIYVANDTTENFLYINDGKGVFKEVGGSMGVDVGDYNLDGRPDIWVANFEVESFALYRNDGNGQFLHVSRATGVTALNGLFVGFGTTFLDADLDGDEDILVNNGHVILHPRGAPLLQEALLLVNHDAKFYRRHLFQPESYFSKVHAGRGLAAGDMDADGDFDMVFTNNLETLAVLRNDTQTTGQWLQVELIGRQSNRNAVGAILNLETTQGKQLRLVKSGVSYLSTCDRRQLWGMPKGANPKTLEVRWPSGKTQQLDVGDAAGTLVRLYEPVQ